MWEKKSIYIYILYIYSYILLFFKHLYSKWRGHLPLFSPCCRQLDNNTNISQSHGKVNTIFFLSNMKLHNIIKGVLCIDSYTATNYLIVKTI